MAIPSLNIGGGKWATKQDKLLAYKQNTGGRYFAINGDTSRNSTATFTNQNGLIESVGNNVARVDFQDDVKGSLLLEPQSTNLFLNSVFTGGVDNVSAPTSWSANIISSPIFTYLTSDYSLGKKINIQCSGSRLILNQSVTIPSNGLINISTKMTYISGSSGVNLIASTLAPPSDSITTYYYNGVLVASNFAPTSNGVLEMRISSVIGGSCGIRLGLGTGTSATGHIELDIPQCEILPYSTSYIPTNGSAVTRVKDVANNFGDVNTFNSSEGVLFVEMAALSDDLTNRYLTVTNGTSSERVAILLGGNTNQLRCIFFSSSQSFNISFSTQSYDVLQSNKLAVKWKSGDFKFYINGDLIGSSTLANTFAPNVLNVFGFNVGGSVLEFKGKVKQLQVYKEALTDAELITLTTI